MTRGGRINFSHIEPQLSLDRAGEKRRDADWCNAKLHSRQARFFLLVDLALAITSNTDQSDTRIRMFSPREINDLGLDLSHALMLGLETDSSALFALSLTMADAIAAFRSETALPALMELRALAIRTDIPATELTLAAQARSLAAWHDTRIFCGRCGARTRIVDAGWRRHCWACGHSHFPRFDPAVIMLIQLGDRCLLAHEPRFPENMYSVLAGFVEPGDDIETAVRREIMEEAGVRVGRVAYVASQPWPFPHSLMIGCWGEALTEALNPDPEEIEDVRWFSRKEVREMIDGTHAEGLFVPPALSISHTLVRAFAEDTLNP